MLVTAVQFPAGLHPHHKNFLKGAILMTISKATKELTSKELYKLTHGNAISISESVKNSCGCFLIEDIKNIYAIKADKENGERYDTTYFETSSGIFYATGTVVFNQAKELIDAFGEEIVGETLEFSYNKSKEGNDYLTLFCVL